MFNLGPGEMLVILLVGLIVLGPTKLPKALKQIGAFISEVRRISAGFRHDLEEVVEAPVREVKSTFNASPTSNSTLPNTSPPSNSSPLDSSASSQDTTDGT